MVAGSGSFDFSGAGIGIDSSLQADNAVLLNRDDLGANVTGPLPIRSRASGGVISGDVQLVRSRFTLGKANAAAEIPELTVIEINRRGETEEDEHTAHYPWRLNAHARAPNRL